MKTNKQKKKHRIIWIAISMLAVLGMLLYLIVPLLTLY